MKMTPINRCDLCNEQKWSEEKDGDQAAGQTGPWLSLPMHERIHSIYIMERHGTGWKCSRKVSSRDP